MRPRTARPYTLRVSQLPTLVVSDAHLGQVPHAITDAFHRFLREVPHRTSHLIVNGDLFDFWFEYRTVIPRSAFRTLAALASLTSAGIRITITGGNHDRWGSDFWEREVGASFHRHEVELDLEGLRTLVTHGDGMEVNLSSRILQAVTRFPLTPKVFRWVHPDVGIAVARRMSSTAAMSSRRQKVLESSAKAQDAHARSLMQRRRDIDLVIFGHTHLPAIVELEPRRWYANPGAWMEGLRYLEVTANGPVLRQFSPNTP